MALISQSSAAEIAGLQSNIVQGIESSGFLEDAAQKTTDLVYDQYQDSVVLARIFATVPYGRLPSGNQQFVDNLSQSQGISDLIQDQTLVLSLLGTRGEETTWNRRQDSQGHVGIPLASADFIDRIPMIARLLNELGVSLDWISSGDSDIVTRSMGETAGVFHVPDAKSTVDHQGRNIIVAQDFVAQHQVKTVFGLGIGFADSPTFAVMILFNREAIDKEVVERLMPLMGGFIESTAGLVTGGKLFSA